MNLDQLFDLWRDNIVASFAIVKDPKLVVGFFRSVDANCYSNVILGKKADYLRCQHRRIGSHAEVNIFADIGRFVASVLDCRFDYFEVKQCLSTKECKMNHPAARRLIEQEINGASSRFLAHELRLAVRCGDAILAVLVTIRAAKIALICHVHYYCLKRERLLRRVKTGFGEPITEGDRVRLMQLIQGLLDCGS